jgi:hypothetical protein
MAALHQKLALAVVLLSLAGLLWSASRASRRVAGGRLISLSWTAVGLIAVQAATGAALALTGRRPADGSHFVFGPITLLALPVALWLRRGRDSRSDSLVVLAGWLVTFALSLRDLGSGGLSA